MEERFQHLLAINRAIAASLDYEEVLRLVVDKTMQLTEARECALLLTDEAGSARVAASRGIDSAKAAAFAAPLDERINGALRELLDHRPEDTFVGVPVIHLGKVTGILVVHREGAYPTDEDEEALLAALADQAAIALDRASRYRDLWAAGQLAQRDLETAARRKDEFLAMLSHELRNPLSAIASAVEVLRLAAPGDRRLEHAHAIAARQTAHMKRLLDDLLDVSRVTRDHIALQRRPLAMQDVLRQALDASAPLIEQRNHRLEVDVPAEPVVVDGDSDRLVQVVSNLLINAAKYTQTGGHLRLALTAGEGNAVVTVRDDGIGITADLLPSVFDLFVQATRDATRTEGGLGIGLSLAKRLVEMHGGTLSAASEGPGRGSEFVVRLPLLPASATGAGRSDRGETTPARR